MTLRRCSRAVKRREPELGIAPAPTCLRMQSLNGISVTTDDVAVASEHGKELPAYVLNDLITTTSAP